MEANARAADWILAPGELAEVDAIAAWDGTSQLAEMVVA